MKDEKKNIKHGRKTVAGNENAIRNLAELQLLREQKRLSQMKLAQLSGVSDKTIRGIELHHIKPANVSILSYLKLAKFFGWEYDDTYDDALKQEEEAQKAPEKNNEVEVWDSQSYSWKDYHSETLKINASKMFNLLNRIASENQVWTIGEVKRLLASVSKTLAHLG